MKDRVIKADDILLVDMGLINRCTLACPLCPYVTKNISSQKKQHVDIKNFIGLLERLPNLEVGIIEGNYSEPTLYPHLPELIAYLKSRSIRIRLSTNGNTKNLKFWKEIGKYCDENDIIRFAIDGSTQEMHSRYRVNGNIETVLANHRAFRSNTSGKTVLQNIIFHYNESDKDNIMKIFHKESFDYVSFIKCYISETSSETFRPIRAIDRFNQLYLKVIQSIDGPQISCDSFNRKEIYVNHEGKVFLCGTLDEDGASQGNPHVTDEIDTIFDYLTSVANNIKNIPTCTSNCNHFCYTLGERYPDITIDKNGVVEEVNYFTKELHNEGDNICHRLI